MMLESPARGISGRDRRIPRNQGSKFLENRQDEHSEEKMTRRSESQGPDQDEKFFDTHPDTREFLRQANPGEWPEDNELLTSPPFTLVVLARAGLILKFGAWRKTANTKNTYVQLKKGRVPISTYLEYLSREHA